MFAFTACRPSCSLLQLVYLAALIAVPLRTGAEESSAAPDLEKQVRDLKREEQQLLKELTELSAKPARSSERSPVRAGAKIQAADPVSRSAKAEAPPADPQDFNRAYSAARAKAAAEQVVEVARPIAAPDEPPARAPDRSVLIAQLKAKNDLSDLVQKESAQLRSDIKALGKNLESMKQDFDLTAQSYAKKDITQDRRMAAIEGDLARARSAIEDDLKSARSAGEGYTASVRELQGEYDSLHAALKEQKTALDALKLTNSQIRARTESSEAGVEKLNTGLAEVKAAVEKIQGGLDRLTLRVADTEKRSEHAIYPTTVNGDIVLPAPEVPLDGPRYSYIPHNAVTDQMDIVTVSVEEAELWSGPGEEDKVVEKSPRGSRLAVEDSITDWFRVIAPDGSRAWIQARNVIFNRDDEMSALRITGTNEQF